MQSQARTPGRNTPGRRRNANKENVYFEPGKYGRKTGLTLQDTGIRDEHGFEPVSGIFSSPHGASPERRPLAKMAIANSIGDVLEPRRTPRMPPPRTQTPRRTNIGGTPVRYSAIKMEQSRRFEDEVTPMRSRVDEMENEEEDVVLSIERVPEQAEIRSSAIAMAKRSRKSIFQLDTPEKTASQMGSSPAPGIVDELSDMLDTHDTQPSEQLHDSGLGEVPVLDESMPPSMDESRADSLTAQSSGTHIDGSNTKRKRKSDVSQIVEEAEVHSSSKRRRVSDRVSLVEPSPSIRNRTSFRRSDVSVPAQVDDEPTDQSLFGPQFDDEPGLDMEPQAEVADLGEQMVEEDEQEQNYQADEQDLAPIIDERGLSPVMEDEDAAAPPSPKRRGRKPVNPRSRRQKGKAASQTDQSRPPRARTFASEPPDAAGGTILGRTRLRSATPFEDPDVQVTRSGRASIKPLAYWKNETFVWSHGEVAGVVRAQELTPPKRKAVARGKIRKVKREEDDEEDEEPEDLLPEAWEEEVGIINGPVRAWDAGTGMGSVDEEELKDVAFASRAIATQDVAGGSFRYAKLVTEPFFGAGVVELPPGGEKRTKNCRRMAMVFFVHEGKVTVDVAGMQFGVAKGGMWQVPRGNNYSIENESGTYTAKIFFAQGCEMGEAAAGVAM